MIEFCTLNNTIIIQYFLILVIGNLVFVLFNVITCHLFYNSLHCYYHVWFISKKAVEKCQLN